MKKKSDLNSGQVTPAHSILKPMVLLLTSIILCTSACKQNVDLQKETGVSNKTSSKTSDQDLPGGKQRFTWVNGNFDTNSYSWERIVQLTFATDGSVGATVWTWKSPEMKDKVVFNSHLCTVAGLTKTVDTYTPYGWMTPSGQYESWTGTYVYNTTTKQLSITWATPSYAAGATENWQITNPTTALARASLLSSNYTLTHGRGYGSSSSFSTYKTITQMVNDGLPNYGSNSKMVAVAAASGTATATVTPSGFNTWVNGALNLSVFNTPSSPSPANTLHYYQPTTNSCDANSCTTTRDGIVYHLALNNNGRSMAYSFWCACLPTAEEFPSYTRALHPAALQQILDDNNNLVAMIGVEVQNPAGASYNGKYLYRLLDFNNIP
jgi:hypothetical protein